MIVKIPDDIYTILKQYKGTFKPKGMIPGKIVFDLVTSKGIPLDIIADLAKEKNLSLDLLSFWQLSLQHKISSISSQLQKQGFLSPKTLTSLNDASLTLSSLNALSTMRCN